MKQILKKIMEENIMTDRERLTELIEKNFHEQYCKRGVFNADLAADFLLKNGVIVPPCKVGDTVYCIEHKTIHECIVTMVKSLTYENKTIFFVETECEIVNPFYSDGRKMKHGIMAVWEVEYGSWYRAFRTREAAEQALKGKI